MRRSFLFLAALAALTVAACQREKKPEAPKFAEVLPEIPMPPGGRGVGRKAGEDALLLTFRTPDPADSVARYYRGVFNQRQWRLVSDAKTKDGAVTLYAEQGAGRPPMWVRILPDSEFGGTLVEVAGARVTGLATPAPISLPPQATPDSARSTPLRAPDSTRPRPIP